MRTPGITPDGATSTAGLRIPIMRTLGIALAGVMVLANRSAAEPVTPAAFDEVEQDQLIRVWTPMQTFSGLFSHQREGQVVIDTERGYRAISLSAIEKVEAARSRTGRTTLIGAGIGAAAGVLTPYAIQLVFYGGCCEFDADGTAASVLILAGVGAAIGAVLGPSSRRWETLAGDASGIRAIGSKPPPVTSIAVHGGNSLFGRVPTANEEPGMQTVRDGRLSFDITLLYRHLIPGEIGVSLLFTTFERPSNISPAPKDEVVVAGPEYRLPLARRAIAPYIGAGLKYITSETSSTTKGRQRALGVDSVVGIRWTPSERLFLELEARGGYGALLIDGDTHHKFASFGAGVGTRY